MAGAEFGAAVGVRDQVGGERGEVGGAEAGVGRARGVEDAGERDEGALGLEEGLGALCAKGKEGMLVIV